MHFYNHLSAFYKKTKALHHLRVFHYDDASKIILSTANTGLSGSALAKELRKRNIETEMACSDFVLAMTSIWDQQESFDALSDALFAIDAKIQSTSEKSTPIMIPLPEQMITPSEAKNINGTVLPLSACKGKVALESVWAYPPGIPFIVPGERITDQMLACWEQLRSFDVELHSTTGNIEKHHLLVI